MFSQLENLKGRFAEVGKMLSDPATVADIKRFTQLNKEYKELEKIVKVYDEYKIVLANIENNKQILENEKDEEFRELAKTDLVQLESDKERLENELKQLLVPKEPEDEKDVLLEIRAGTGGDEASLFAGDLARMYTRYCESLGWQVSIVDANEGTVGGFKEIVLEIKGENVYGKLKFESGVHRVQRVPETEAKGRVHTSAVTVAVLPEADEVDVQINESDIVMDVFRASGAGGQHVNRTESAVRLTHIPTGTVVTCQQERSQHKNREMALKMLKTKIYEAAVRKHEEEIAARRKTLVSTGDRSAKIRTYNYPQGRVTDHRINLSIYNLDAFMNGDIGEMIDALAVAEQAEKLKEGNFAF
ncbi:MAG: peptide chain release factor 1 [Chitinophagales bacterium]|nr:peptide chain release factor 1 [Chitinophagales bacterium]MDW8418207.1 peptide chain release factor 1 [Chitinophagales bacterium]